MGDSPKPPSERRDIAKRATSGEPGLRGISSRSIGLTLLAVVLGGLALIVGAYLLIGLVVPVTRAAITPAQRFTAAFATATALGALIALVLNIRKQDLAEQLARREITAAFTERFRSAAAQLGGTITRRTPRRRLRDGRPRR